MKFWRADAHRAHTGSARSELDQKCVIMPNFITIGQTVAHAELWQINDFSKWQPSVILNLFVAHCGHLRCLLGGLYRFAKFG